MQQKTDANRGVLLDTHIWIHLQSGLPILSKPALDAISMAASRRSVYIPLISIWEVAMLTAKKRLRLDPTVRQWVEQALDKPGLQLLFFTTEIAIEAALLPEPMHKDPADRIIMASAKVERLTLISSDKPMLAFAKTIGISTIQG